LIISEKYKIEICVSNYQGFLFGLTSVSYTLGKGLTKHQPVSEDLRINQKELKKTNKNRNVD
jgi:hypothetical protein